jgi:hypothetical protein
MRETGLLAPHRVGRTETRPHDGTIITDKVNEPKSGSWRPAAVWQIADIMRYGQETRGFAAATGG